VWINIDGQKRNGSITNRCLEGKRRKSGENKKANKIKYIVNEIIKLT